MHQNGQLILRNIINLHNIIKTYFNPKKIYFTMLLFLLYFFINADLASIGDFQKHYLTILTDPKLPTPKK